MFKQILSGQRQTGKTTWLYERAKRETANRERRCMIVCAAPNESTRRELRDGLRKLDPVMRILTPESLDMGVRGLTLDIDHVIILLDEVDQLHQPAEEIVQYIRTKVEPAVAGSGTEYHIYATNTIGENP